MERPPPGKESPGRPDVEHLPVLVREAVELLAPWREEGSGLFVDATVGLGGHAEALLAAGAARPSGIQLVGIDRDPAALSRAARRLAPHGDRVRFVQGNFHQLVELLAANGIGAGGQGSGGQLAGVLADLGVSSLQLGTAERGFSFRLDGPLDMRMGVDGPTAAEIVNTASEAELEKIFREYGEERQARRIARAIGAARRNEPIETTGELADLIGRAKGGHREREGRVDPATRVFQALRIAVNQELAGLDRFIQQAVDLMEANGRLVIISYHSLEDRIVKHGLRDLARGEADPTTGRVRAETRVLELMTKKPLRPSEEELAANPRSRSARLRAARRL
jgi:16S rRNA (cytosine1402-N4)-methyltransferase